MNNKQSLIPVYPVKELEVEHIVIRSPQQMRNIRALQQRNRFQQFIDNVALAIITGSIQEATVQQRTTPQVFDAVLRSMDKFDELEELYTSPSTLEGENNEYLDPTVFTFRKTPHGITQ